MIQVDDHSKTGVFQPFGQATSILSLAKQPAGPSVDEVQPVAGQTPYGFVDLAALLATVVIDLALDIERRVRAAKNEIGHAPTLGWPEAA
jgi:hypothetical protein